MSFTFVDLFAGCGGLSLGLVNAGGTGLLAVEKDEDAFDTLYSNLAAPAGPLAGFEWTSLIKPGASTTRRLLNEKSSELKQLAADVDVLAGGPPCQGFSLYGRRNRDDGRNRLYLEYLQTVELLQPSVVLLENVVGIDMPFVSKGKATGRQCRETVAHRIVDRLHSLGYQTGTFSLCASEFGVPQYRRRLFVVGVKTERDVTALLDPSYVEKLRQAYVQSLGLKDGLSVSVEDAIGDLRTRGKSLISCVDVVNRMQVDYGGPISEYQRAMHEDLSPLYAPTSMRLAKHSHAVTEKFSLVQRTGTPGTRIDEETRKALGMSKHRTHWLAKNKPSVTVTTLPDDFIHYDEARILTVRELARLQSFPDWFGFCGPYTSGGDRRARQCPRYTQVGNAVPVRLAQFMGTYVDDILKNIRSVEGYRLAA